VCDIDMDMDMDEKRQGHELAPRPATIDLVTKGSAFLTIYSHSSGVKNPRHKKARGLQLSVVIVPRGISPSF
jgi:hypothetical protein